MYMYCICASTLTIKSQLSPLVALETPASDCLLCCRAVGDSRAANTGRQTNIFDKYCDKCVHRQRNGWNKRQ